MAENKPTLAPFVAPTILDTTGSDRTDLKSVLQLFGDELAAQNQVLRKLIDHWDSISRLQFSGSVKKLFITRHQESGDPVLEYTFSDGAQITNVCNLGKVSGRLTCPASLLILRAIVEVGERDAAVA